MPVAPPARTYQELLPVFPRTDRQFRGTIDRVYVLQPGELYYDIILEVAATHRRAILPRVRETVPSPYPNEYTVRQKGDIVVLHQISRTAWEIVGSVAGIQNTEPDDNPSSMVAKGGTVSLDKEGAVISSEEAMLGVTHDEVFLYGPNDKAMVRIRRDEVNISTPAIGLHSQWENRIKIYHSGLEQSDKHQRLISIRQDEDLVFDTSFSRNPGGDAAANRRTSRIQVGNHGYHQHTYPDHYHYTDLTSATRRSVTVEADKQPRITRLTQIEVNENLLEGTTEGSLPELPAPTGLIMTAVAESRGETTVTSYNLQWSSSASPTGATVYYDVRMIVQDFMDEESAQAVYASAQFNTERLFSHAVPQAVGLIRSSILLKGVSLRSQDLSMADEIEDESPGSYVVPINTGAVFARQIGSVQIRGFQVRARQADPVIMSKWSDPVFRVGYHYNAEGHNEHLGKPIGQI